MAFLFVAYLLVSLIFTLPYIIRYVRIRRLESVKASGLASMPIDMVTSLKD